MTPKVSGLCVATMLALTAGVGAQQPGPGGPARNDGVTTPNDFEQTASKTAQTLSLTGCVDRANDGTYQLTHARPSPPSATGTSGTPGRADNPAGTTGTAGSSAAADSNDQKDRAKQSAWILKSTTDLAPHVGHSVQITGRMSSPDRNGTNTATTTNPTTTATGARIEKPSEEAHSVEVQSVRMISRSCP
jgi:hypothetical protein